ncbi:MAG TPA: TRAP transporter small permease [Desulfobulbaceae bacterium]|nr:TRAP transporter small permease [Desulfobulbaceae bacterium]
MKSTWRSFIQGVEKLSRFGAILGECVLILLLLLVFHEVVVRYIFNKPTLYSVEISEYLLIFLAFIAAGSVLQEDKHVRMQSFTNLMPKRMQRVLACIISSIVLMFCSILVWQGIKSALMAYRGGYHSSSLLNTPMWLPYLIIPVGSLILALQLIVQINSHIAKLIGDAEK